MNIQTVTGLGNVKHLGLPTSFGDWNIYSSVDLYSKLLLYLLDSSHLTLLSLFNPSIKSLCPVFGTPGSPSTTVTPTSIDVLKAAYYSRQCRAPLMNLLSLLSFLRQQSLVLTVQHTVPVDLPVNPEPLERIVFFQHTISMLQRKQEIKD